MGRAKTCSKCAGRMAEGALLTKDSNGWSGETKWLEGPVESSMWTGLKTKDRTIKAIVSYCCERCGLLESYAE